MWSRTVISGGLFESYWICSDQLYIAPYLYGTLFYLSPLWTAALRPIINCFVSVDGVRKEVCKDCLILAYLSSKQSLVFLNFLSTIYFVFLFVFFLPLAYQNLFLSMLHLDLAASKSLAHDRETWGQITRLMHMPDEVWHGARRTWSGQVSLTA